MIGDLQDTSYLGKNQRKGIWDILGGRGELLGQIGDTVECTMAFLYSHWLYFPWHGIINNYSASACWI